MVIGSGIGGLGAAAMLARRRGMRVLVLERHYTAGGFTHTFERDGFEWDVGVHYVGKMTGRRGALRRLFDYITNGELDWAPMPDVYDRIVVGDREFDLAAGPDRFVEGLASAFPSERKGITTYLAQVKACARAAGPYFGTRALPPRVAGLLGGLMRRGFLRHARRTTGEVIASHVKDPVLRAVLAGQYGDAILLLAGGGRWALGGGDEVLTPERLQEAFGVRVAAVDVGGGRFVTPLGKYGRGYRA